MDLLISLGEFISHNKTLVIPEYQRGYVWGRIEGAKTILSHTC